MKEMKVFSYIKKYRILIVIASIAMGILFYMYFSGRQTYTAVAIIQYTNPEAKNGLAPDGTEIDTSEIYSSEVMIRVFQKMNLSYDENNMDAIRAAITVKPVLSQEEASVQEALNEKGEVWEEQSTVYQVSYTVGKDSVSNGQEFAAKLLTTMLNVYTEVYAENHVNNSVSPNDISDIYDADYDYIEMVEIIDNSIGEAINNLGYKSDLEFRSATTGYSFKDLQGEFALLRDIDLSSLYAYILENTITKDQDVLLSKYENRIKNYTLENGASESQINGIEEIINSYVDMMRESGNTEFTYEYILGDVYDNYYRNITADPNSESYLNADVTTEYDNLMNGYVKGRTGFEESLIDIGYAQYILNIFSGDSGGSGGIEVNVIENPSELNNHGDAAGGAGGEAGASGTEAVGGEEGASTEGDSFRDGVLTFTTNTEKRRDIVSSEEEKSRAYNKIKDLVNELNRLYEIVAESNREYNQFAGAENISIMTDTVTSESINLFIYAVLSVVLFGIAGCAAAVVCGRLFEIFEYYVYVDKKFDIANRAGCDRYIGKFENKMITEEVSCVYFKMMDIETKNRIHGGEHCDEMIRDFCSMLQAIFPKEQSFIAMNGVGQFVIFINDIERDLVRAYVNECGRQCMDYNATKACKISYVCGISSSSTDEIYNLRKLMLDAIRKAAAAIK